MWQIGLILGIESALSVWVTAGLAVEWGATFVRCVFIAVVAESGVKLLGVFDSVGQLFG